MAVDASTANESLQECEPDEFVLIYLKDRIEWDGKYTWYDAPQVRPQLTPKCETLKQAALLFEGQKMEKLKKMLLPLIETRNLNYKSFKYVLDSCFDLLQERKPREWRRDFRKEISQISLYASTSLQSKLKLMFGRSEDTSPTYSWNKFLKETQDWMNRLKYTRIPLLLCLWLQRLC
uniref:Uncharacterized protein n=1 Tax=Ditylenchus dipsaci TaxID=166011 RepID=A0A915D0P5_9BILA